MNVLNKDLMRSIELLKDGNFTCVLVKNDSIFTSKERGVKPILAFLENSDCDFTDYSAADKIVGKAAAFLYVLLRVKRVFALTVSEPAAFVLEKYGIEITYENRVKAIRNRTNTGFCPMEQSVIDIDSPDEAFYAIKKRLSELQSQ